MTKERPKRLALLQIGVLGALEYPALLPYDASRPWLQLSNVNTHARAAEICEGVALQLLNQHDSGEARLLLFEATPSPYFAQIKRLLAVSDHVWGEQLFTAKDCLQQLTELEELVHRRFSLLAQAGVVDIYEYNHKAARSEPLIYLLINGLGSSLSEPKALQQLETLCRQGACVGIVPLLLYQPDEEVVTHSAESRREAMQSFNQLMLSLGSGLMMKVVPPQPINIPDGLWSLLQRFDLQISLAKLVKAWCDDLIAKTELEDNNGERDFLNIPIGLSGATPINFSMGEKSDVYHALIGGTTRTGKTTLLNNLILKACEAYTPEQLQLTLMDFKDGVSFWEYEGLGHVANLYAPIEDDFATAIVCLKDFSKQIQRRNAQFRTERVARLADYNKVAKQPLPRCLLVIDEVQSLFEGRDFKQTTAVKQIISTVAKKGAAAGLHMILSTQSFDGVDLGGGVKGQFHLRIGLDHGTDTVACMALMGRDNYAPLGLGRFTAVYNSHQGVPKHNRVVALDDLPSFLESLDKLKAKYPYVMAELGKDNNKVPQVKPQGVEPASRFVDGDVSGEW